MIRVFVVAQSSIGRAELEDLIGSDPRFSVVGSGTSITGWEWSLRERPPDVLCMEASDNEGLPRRSRISEIPPIVLLAEESSRAQTRTWLSRGAHAILPRQSSWQEIAAALIAAAAGLTVLGSEYMDVLLPSALLESERALVEPLTARELQVLTLLAEGAANKDIAHRLAISEHTVKFHVSSILGKLGTSSRTEAAREGVRRGLILF